ncbi:hypothetical protein J1N35_022816 [Gossypium stocksii]|uniref:Uncharacterized protein n=1 Tax=Gossypium stocksii TaxID=47602 RepID=A0A9D3VH66_9ROSI|nr:hypothetical protein J1N35_022816 [Gossypium stocksii]
MDFIDGAEVVSILECIQLSAGPLLALAAAPWHARVSPAPVVRAISAAISSMSRQSRYIPLLYFCQAAELRMLMRQLLVQQEILLCLLLQGVMVPVGLQC